ncbi:MAG: helix-hairpin-helix domain-containing protein [Desulfomonilia bacterium]|nr:helix-hairpin-helix domain-containing protein [Deltaproteobacteria bacterium]MDX9761328.1 helix-hairpin-helix domain-containing protein [Desulfomonilia bacterium]HPW68563.1 helix-hairpin-helix domain-containing protein [Deltaproteobacteria bacterium]
MKRLIVLGIAMLAFMFTFGGMAHGDYYPWGKGSANVNTATQEELEWFLGRSNIANPDQVARNILEYREASGPFTSVDELKNVEGMEDITDFEEARFWLKTTGPTDYDPEKTLRPHGDPFFGYGFQGDRRGD